jgi:hypothetical protein
MINKKNNKIGNFGKVYKLTSLDPQNNHVYIGSTSSFYFSVRLCQHVDNLRQGKDYFGIFDEYGKCNSEIIDIVSKDENYKSNLKKMERYHLSNHMNTINIRKPCYYDKNEETQCRKNSVKKYQESEKGQVAIQKTLFNKKIKDLNEKLKIVVDELNKYLHEEATSYQPKTIQQVVRKNTYEYKIKEYQAKLEVLKIERNNLILSSRSLFVGDEETV